MKLLGRVFLGVVGLEYIALGLVGLAGLQLGSDDLLVYCAFATWFFLVAPMALVQDNGVQASCYGKPTVWRCGLGDEVMQEARLVLFVLCLLSIAGGLAGAWGAWTGRTSAGRSVWHVLVWISGVVAIWNMGWLFGAPTGTNPFIGSTSVVWAAAYAFVAIRVFRENG